MADTPRIVVGIDGSPDSEEALRWAIAQVERMGATVEAVTAWEVPISIVIVPTATEEDYENRAREVLQATIDAVLDGTPPVPVSAYPIEGRPANALTNQARGADLLVIGSHGRGELPGMHLGSVASYCVHHAPCPVVVLRRAAP
jgi:nucleotide-binding universal stress UspA family protein